MSNMNFRDWLIKNEIAATSPPRRPSGTAMGRNRVFVPRAYYTARGEYAPPSHKVAGSLLKTVQQAYEKGRYSHLGGTRPWIQTWNPITSTGTQYKFTMTITNSLLTGDEDQQELEDKCVELIQQDPNLMQNVNSAKLDLKTLQVLNVQKLNDGNLQVVVGLQTNRGYY